MKRGFFIFFLIVQLLFGRENPFLPAKEYKGIDTPTNVVIERGDFEQQSLSLPSNARVLKYVLFGYQTLNGDVEEMRMEVNKDVDWHDPMVVTKESVLINPPLVAPPVSQVNPPTQQTKEEISQKPLTTPQTSPNLNQSNETINSQASPDHRVAKKNSVTVGFGELIGFEAFSKRLIVVSEDQLLRHFMVVDPYKIVLDFKKDSAFYTKTLHVKHGAFQNIVLGNHSGYYRAAITLDGHYLYEIKEILGGFEILLK